MLKKLSSKQLYSDNWLTFHQDEIELPDGSTSTYAYAKRQNGVGVVVVSANQKILLHKEHRYVINDYSWEVQGGGIDWGETPQQAAVREVQEEAGVTISESDLIPLGEFYPLHSFNTELVTFFMVVVESEELGEQATEHGEHLEERQFFSFDEIYEMIETGKINDAATANAVQLAMRRYEEMKK